MLLDSHKVIFIKNEAVLLCVTLRKGATAFAATIQCVTFLIQLLQLQSSVFAVHFFNAFWLGNEAFSKGSYQFKLFLGVKICFHSSRYENQKFPLVQYSCRTGVVRVAFVLHSCHSCLTRSCRSCRTRVARVWHSCCEIDQINSSEQMFLNEQLIKENLKLMNHNISNVG